MNNLGLEHRVVWRTYRGGVIRSAISGAIAGTLFLCLFFALNHWSLGRGGEERIQEARASGAITSEDYAPGNTSIGHNQFNDCLIIGMALDQRHSRTELTVSPSVPVEGYGICSRLGAQTTERFFYHNYLHGHTMLTRYLLPLMSVQQIRDLYRLSITIVLMAGIAVSMLRIAKGRSKAAVFLIALLALSRFFGLETYGQSLGHAPADFILIGFVTLLAISDLTRLGAVLASAAFGAMTMIFEFMTGGLPLGLAIVIGLTWFALREPNLPTVVSATIAYSAAAASTLFLKLIAVWVVFGTGAVSGVFSAAASRSVGSVPSGLDDRLLFHAIAGNTDAMVPGFGPMAATFVVLAIGFGSYGLYRNTTMPAKLLAISNLPVVIWFALFQQHTIVHAWFMDRILVWFVASGFSLFLLATCDRRPSSS